MWKKLKSKTIFEHPRITLIEDTVQLPDGTKTEYLTYLAKNDSATIICVSGGKVLLQKEYSYPANELLYQFPGGKLEANETAAEGAARELAEEAGLKPGSLDKIGWFYVDNRRTSAKMHVYLAKDCTLTAKEGGDKEEDISDHWVSLGQVDAMIKSGEIVNYSVLAAWSIYKSVA